VIRKTGWRQIIPMPAPLLSWFESLPGTDNPKDFVFPKVAAILKASKNEHTGALISARSRSTFCQVSHAMSPRRCPPV